MSRPAPSLALVLPLATLAGAAVAGLVVGIEIALLVVASGALLGTIALLWASVQSLTGESSITLEEALSLGAPSAEEEQKRAVLRALKDLEFERGVGKISEEDYAELSARYRAEARRLILAVDEGHAKERAEVERQLAIRLKQAEEEAAAKKAMPAPSATPASEPDSEPDSAPEPDSTAKESA